MALPKTTQERIKADAGKAYPISWQYQERIGYIAGATAEAERAQDELKQAKDAAIMFCNKYNAISNQLAETVDWTQRQQEKELRERYERALKWYADEGNYLDDNGKLATAWENNMSLKANRALNPK